MQKTSWLRPLLPRLLRSLLRYGAAVVLVPLLACGLYYGKWALFDHRLVTITPGAVYQSAAFPPDELVEATHALGIRTVLDLRDVEPDKVAAEEAALTAASVRHVHLPMPLDPTVEDIDHFLTAMANIERPVLIHCKHGEGRSVLMCAIHRIENEGWSNEGAFDGTARLPEALRFLHVWFPALARFRPDSAKGKLLLAHRRQSKKD